MLRTDHIVSFDLYVDAERLKSCEPDLQRNCTKILENNQIFNGICGANRPINGDHVSIRINAP